MRMLGASFTFILLLDFTSGNANFHEKIASPTEFLASLSDSGTFVFTGLGNKYTKAIQYMRKSSPDCLQDALELELEDGSKRFTTARDSKTDGRPFPSCVLQSIQTITEYFNVIDKFVIDVLKQNFNTRLEIFKKNKTIELDTLPTKSHLHVYKKGSESSPSFQSSLSLPYHTDNGLYLLLTPSDSLPLKTINSNGTVSNLYSKDDSVIFLLGSGLTSWLLPSEDLFAPPHAVPSLTNSLSTKQSRTVFARMKVAPLDAQNKQSKQTFGEYFYSSLTGPTTMPGTESEEEDRHQGRMRRQVGGDHAQHWPSTTTTTRRPKGSG